MPPFTLLRDSPDVLKNVDLHPFLDSLRSLLGHNFIEFKMLSLFKFFVGVIRFCHKMGGITFVFSSFHRTGLPSPNCTSLLSLNMAS